MYVEATLKKKRKLYLEFCIKSWNLRVHKSGNPASYLAHICTYAPDICTSNSDSDFSFEWQPFWYFSLICCRAHTDCYRDFILHILVYLFFTFIHKRNNASVTFFLKFMSIFSKSMYSLLL